MKLDTIEDLHMQKIRFMTHNQWKNDNNRPEWENKGLDCSAKTRAKGFMRVYRETMPHIIGCQETSATMADEIIRSCSDSGMRFALLWGRDTPILYDPDKFEVVNSYFSLYPEEFPEHEGSFNNSNTKSYNIGVFREKSEGKLFIFASTHLWWKSNNPSSPNFQPFSDEARAYQIGILTEKIEAVRAIYKCPAIIVGDLNAKYNSLALKKAFSYGYIHAHDVAVDHSDNSVGYHNCFGWGFDDFYSNAPFEDAIDHILIKGAEEHSVRCFERYSPQYYLPLSDHSPAFIDMMF